MKNQLCFSRISCRNFNLNFFRRWWLAAAVCVSLVCGHSVQAGTTTWTGNAANGYWSSALNWGFGGVPSDGDTLIFPSSAAQTKATNNIAGLTLNQIRFSSSGSSFWLAGNAFTLTNGIIATNNATADLIANDITLSVADCSILVDGGLRLELEGQLAGAYGIIKSGTGGLYLENSNSYAGQTIVSEGVIHIYDSHALGTTNGSTVVSNGASLQFGFINGGATELTSVTNETLILNGYGYGTAGLALYATPFAPTIATNTWAGPVVLASDTSMSGAASNTLCIVGTISGAGNLEVGFSVPNGFSHGTVTCFGGSSANTYTGTTTVMQDTTLLLAKTLGAAISYGSLTIQSNGLVREMASFQLGAIPITVGTNAIFDLNGYSDTVGTNLNLVGEVSPVLGGIVKLGGGTLTFSGSNTTINVVGYGYLNTSPGAGGKVVLGSGNCVMSVPNGSHELYANCILDGSSNSTLTLSGSGSFYLAGTNTYAGQINGDNNADIYLQNNLALGSTNASTVLSNSASVFLKDVYGTGRGVCITNETLVMRSGKLGAQSAGDTNIWAGPIVLDSSHNYVAAGYFENNSMGFTLRVVGPISGTSHLTVNYQTFETNDLVYLEGSTANTYSGSTTLEQGGLVLAKSVTNGGIGSGTLTIGNSPVYPAFVRLESNAQIPDSDPVVIYTNGLLNLNNISDTVGALSGGGSVTLGTGTLGANSDDGTSTFSGIISGTGGLKKHGTGTLTLTGTNTFTGTNEIVLGTEIVDGSDLQSPVLVDSPAKLGGSGTVGRVTSAGRIAPGTGIGTLTTSNLVFTSSGTLNEEIGGSSAYDQVNVHGTVTLASASLQVVPIFTNAAVLGQTFMIITNDGADAVSGIFNGLAEGATFVTAGYKFKISYTGGTGNDVVLTLLGFPGDVTGSSVTAGNGNHAIDPNECNDLAVVLTNTTGAIMTGVTGTLYTTTMNVMILQPQSPYSNLAALGKGTNSIAFGISTLPGFVCGTNISLLLAVTTTSHGNFNIPFILHTGETATGPLRFDNSTVLPIPDGFNAESTNNVSGFTGPLEKVAVMLWLTHPRDSDLDISLISPAGVSVTLASALGGAGVNYGTNCAPDSARTIFDDFAPGSITAASAPFIGVFRPQSSLAAFNYGTANGAWRLHIADTVPGMFGSLQCWSLLLYPVACTGGGGFCGTCPPAISGAITGGDLSTAAGRIFINSIASSCLTAKAYPGATPGTFHYDTYSFTNNTGADVCISVGLISAFDVESCAYLPAFNPANLALNYLGDAGTGTTAAGGSTSFSVNCPAGSNFVVTVAEMTPGAGAPSYTLVVNGLTCPPPLLAIAPVTTNAVRVDWPTYAVGYKLAATLSLSPTNWFEVTNEPVVSSGRFAVTNNSAISNKFYRLHEP